MRAALASAEDMPERKCFYFEKKKQKTFARLLDAADTSGTH
jgi:hypothetical protein